MSEITENTYTKYNWRVQYSIVSLKKWYFFLHCRFWKLSWRWNEMLSIVLHRNILQVLGTKRMFHSWINNWHNWPVERALSGLRGIAEASQTRLVVHAEKQKRGHGVLKLPQSWSRICGLSKYFLWLMFESGIFHNFLWSLAAAVLRRP
jgi:hypothetical protein